MVSVISLAFQKSDSVEKVHTSRVSDRSAYVEQFIVLLHSVDAYNKRVKDDILRVHINVGLQIHRFLKESL